MTNDSAKPKKAEKPAVKKPESKPETKLETKPVSSDEYKRTTGESPDSTSVIPAVPPAPVVEAPAGRRDAKLRLTHIEPWSVTRMAFIVSVAMMIVGVVATVVFWVALNMLGVWDQISDSVTSVLSDTDDAFDITDYLGLGRLVGLSLLLSVVNVVVMTVLATIAAHLYNLAAHVLGGIEVTFTNDK